MDAAKVVTLVTRNELMVFGGNLREEVLDNKKSMCQSIMKVAHGAELSRYAL